MNFIAVEAPAFGVAKPGKAAEFFDAAFGIVATRQLLQVVSDQLIQAFSEGVRLFSCARYHVLING